MKRLAGVSCPADENQEEPPLDKTAPACAPRDHSGPMIETGGWKDLMA